MFNLMYSFIIKNIIGVFVVMFMGITLTHAQQFIVEKVDHTSLAYKDLETAIEMAEDGSKVYIPAGEHYIRKTVLVAGANRPTTIAISKQLHLIGAGAENNRLYNTFINGTFVFMNAGASNSTITGIRFINEMRWHQLNNMLMTRCYVGGSLILSGNGRNNIVEECELYSINNYTTLYGTARSTSTNYMEIKPQKNVISGMLYDLRKTIIAYNVFTSGTNPFGSANNTNPCDSIVISNNIFTYTSGNNSNFIATHTNITNNVFSGSFTLGPDTNNQTGNKVNATNIFQTGTYWVLSENSPAKNVGLNGLDAGIYGAPVPHKGNLKPGNPQIKRAGIEGFTNKDGKLGVDVQVDAQKR